MPPPSAGGVAVLQILGELALQTPQGFVRGEVAATHALIESMRRSYADRASYLGDPAFTNIPLGELLSTEHVRALASTIDKAHATDSRSLLKAPSSGSARGEPRAAEGGVAPASPHNTTHLSVIDKEGNAVALTTTVNYAFGSCVVARGTGVLLNDEMDDFAAQPMTPNVFGLVTGEANAVAPGKVPLSSMSPTLVFQKDSPQEVMLAVGSPGGPTIPTATLQVISNVVDQGMDLPRAVAAGRIHQQWLPDVVLWERFALEPATVRALEQLGHKLQLVAGLGDVEAVGVDPVTHLRYAASDPRGEGLSLGQE
jgi:gamma-glutamyltranspeptidase/glutathione hydrolase